MYMNISRLNSSPASLLLGMILDIDDISSGSFLHLFLISSMRPIYSLEESSDIIKLVTCLDLHEMPSVRCMSSSSI